MPGRENRISELGAVCLRLRSDPRRKAEVLLLMDRENECWTIPTGLSVPKVHPRDIIQQTTWMSAGLKGPVWKRALGHFSYSRAADDGKQATVQVRVHIVNVSKTEVRHPRHPYQIRWVDPDQACEMVHEPALGDLLAKVPDEVSRLLKRMARSPAALDPFRSYRAIETITSRSGPSDDVEPNRNVRAARLFRLGGKSVEGDFAAKATREFRGERGP